MYFIIGPLEYLGCQLDCKLRAQTLALKILERFIEKTPFIENADTWHLRLDYYAMR